MALPTLHRQQIVDAVTAAVQVIDSSTGEYRHTPATVTSVLRPADAVLPEDTPWVGVVAGDGGREAGLSGATNDTVDVVLLVYARRDEARWPGKSAPELLEEYAADVEKALGADPSLGGLAHWEGVRYEPAHDLEGRFSVLKMVRTYRYRNRRA